MMMMIIIIIIMIMIYTVRLVSDLQSGLRN
jgi:hypothetical protein